MKNGGKNQSVAIIILLSVYIYIYRYIYNVCMCHGTHGDPGTRRRGL